MTSLISVLNKLVYLFQPMPYVEAI